MLNEPGKPHIALGYIQKLYGVEKQLINVSDTQKAIVRQNLSRPIIDEFYAWLNKQLQLVLPKCHFATAIKYALKFWDELILYCQHGFLDIDNNAAERAMRPIALGRKNWLFVGSNEGGKTAATIMSVIETAKQNKKNVISYLQHLLDDEKYGEMVGCG